MEVSLRWGIRSEHVFSKIVRNFRTIIFFNCEFLNDVRKIAANTVAQGILEFPPWQVFLCVWAFPRKALLYSGRRWLDLNYAWCPKAGRQDHTMGRPISGSSTVLSGRSINRREPPLARGWP